MKFPKTQIYKDERNYQLYRYTHTRCERCSSIAVDVHHIIPKGMGGANRDDRDSNLIALCRACHDYAHGINSRQAKTELLMIKERQRDENRSHF